MNRAAAGRADFYTRNSSLFASYAAAAVLLGSHATFALSNSAKVQPYNFNPDIAAQQIGPNLLLLGKETGIYIDTSVADCQNPMSGGLAELEIPESTDGKVAIGINNNEDSDVIQDGVEITLTKHTMKLVSLNGPDTPITLNRDTALGVVEETKTNDNHAFEQYIAIGPHGTVFNELSVSCNNN